VAARTRPIEKERISQVTTKLYPVAGAMCAGLLFCIAHRAAAEDKPTNLLEPFGRLVGGEWIGEGKHGGDSDFRTRVVYEWGINHKLLKARSYLRQNGAEKLVYESVFAWHPQKKTVIFMSFAADGHIFDGTMEAKGDAFDGLWNAYAEGRTATYRQTLRMLDADTMSWTVYAKKGDAWEKVIDSKAHRERGHASSADIAPGKPPADTSK
jgi:hypothetical protein